MRAAYPHGTLIARARAACKMSVPNARLLVPRKSVSGGLASPANSAAGAALLVKKGPPSFITGTKEMFLGNRLYALLIFVPLAFLAEAQELPDAVIFLVACLAILPLAGLLGEATEQVALHTNDTLGGLLNATFGNATEMIVCYMCLKQNLLNVVKVSLLGSILSNTLLVLGGAILAGGVVSMTSKFNQTAAQANTTLLQISILSLVVPALMNSIGQLPEGGANDLELSRSISIALLCLYGLYVYFQLVTHRTIFEEAVKEGDKDEDEEEETVYFSLWGGILWLVVATGAIAFLSELLTGAIEGASEEVGLGKAFVGFVIIPIIGNAAEHSTAIVMAAKGKMDLAFGVALGSSTQIALFVIPFMVLVAWGMDKPLDLFFGSFETAIIFMAALIVSHVVADGESNWLEGVMLLVAYCIICFAFFFYTPDEAPLSASPGVE